MGRTGLQPYNQQPKLRDFVADRTAKDAETIAGYERLIADLENPLQPFYGNHRPEELSEIGVLRSNIRVFQVIDTSNAIIEVQSYTSGERTIRLRPRNNPNATARVGGRPEEHSTMYWLSVVPTDTFRDGSRIELDGFFTVTSNRTYETPTGSNTVLTIEPFDIEPHKDLFTRKDELRTWTSKGGHSTEAIFVR